MAINGNVVVIDDEKNITYVIEAVLQKEGFKTLVFNDSQKAIEQLDTIDADLIITDLYMPGPDGMKVLDACREKAPHVPVVMISAYGTVESAVNALKEGAFDFVTKPFDQAELLSVVRKAVATHTQSKKEPLTLGVSQPVGKAKLPRAFSIVGVSSQIREVFRVIEKVAKSPSTVLVSGESGTGKELVAYELHSQSDRKNKPFVKVNCAAIPATLIEAELFGFEKGAFTGAVAAKPGRFELANEGTLFLDEVADMPIEMQVKLLRVLQEQEFERVGGVSSIKVDVRIVAATNKDLEQEVQEGRFREDLFYRLNVVPVFLPPLRERKEDIRLLVNYFVEQFNKKLKKSVAQIDQQVLEILVNQPWPGNIRQLENVLERMVLMSDGTRLSLEDLPDGVSPQSELGRPNDARSEVTDEQGLKQIVRKQTQSLEKNLIAKALEETGGNVTRAAEKLGLSRKGLQIKMKELGLSKV